jgi:hypothetical protein
MTSNSILASQDCFATRVSASTLVVFDSRVSDIETLSQALLPGSFAESGLCPIDFTIDAEDDGLGTITQLLAATGAKYLAIVAHGEPGVVHLGKNPLNIEQLQAQSQLLSAWGVKEIALYSCEVAQGDIGKDLIYQLSELTGATVAAAATKIGNAALGGSWDLTVTTGEIAAPDLFQASILQTYQSVLVVRFGDKTTIPAGTNVNSVDLRDLNGDGKFDIFTANRGSSDVSVLLGDGVGGFSPAINYPVGTDPIGATVGDFNSDGKLDIFTANRGSSTISVLLGNGVGGFGLASTYAAGAGASGARVGDFNGDGKLDLSTTNYGSNTVSILFGDGLGGFGTATNYTVGSTPYGTVMGDFNGDGKLDFITAGSGTSSLLLSVLLNNGSGGFNAAANVAVDSNPGYIRSGDFNGDGKLDLAMTDDTDKISVLLGNGTGGFGVATKFATASTPNRYGYTAFPENLVVGDFNSDGKLDLLSGTLQQNFPGPGSRGVSDESLFLGDGAGGFSLAVSTSDSTDPFYDIGLGDASNLIAGDINGDGRLDVVAANGSDNSVSVLLNVLINRNDFNGDRKSDILWRNTDGSVALWQMNSSTATPSSVGSLTSDWRIAGTGDFSGGRKSDILLANTNGAVATWQMNGSTITKATQIGTLTAGWSIAGTGDLNGDGTADVILTNTNGTVAEWQVNNSTVTAAKTIGTLTAGWSIAGTADFNGDGKADILLQNTNGTIALWQMDGATVTTASLVGTTTADWKIAGVADFNGDGKADILWRNTNGSVAEWQMNGSTVASTSVIGSATTDWKIAGTGDYNGDGNADILWRNDLGTVATWQLNGSTILAAGATSIPTAPTSWQIAAPIL